MTPEMSEFLRLAPLGFAVGAYGTLVGAGGGSVLVPALLILLPHETPATITAISLGVVFFNAYSGTIAYMRMGRIDYRTAVLFTIASLPGAIIGALLVHKIPRGIFDPLFGVVLLGLRALLVVFPVARLTSELPEPDVSRSWRGSLVGSIGSGYIAIFSSLLGIGGGIIHVPFLIHFLRQSAHRATATSHFVLTFMALTATVTHVVTGEFNRGLAQTMYLSVGVLMGAPLGAALSTKLQGSLIVRLLAVALSLVGARLLARVFL